jgi:hypothetical protein
MKQAIKTALLGALTMLALSLATAGVAAAATKPEFKPVPTKKKFTLSSGKSEWASGDNEIVCAKTSATGEIDSAQAVGNVVVVYSGCTSSGKTKSGCPANSEGAKAGEIVTTPLTGELGTVATSEAASGVGLRFKQSPKGVWFVLQGNECNFESAFEGGLAAEVSVIGKKQTTNELLFVRNGAVEKIREITLDSGLVEKPGFKEFGGVWTVRDSDELKFEEPVEIT